MIVTEVPGDRLEVVTQVDHARFAADLLGLWVTEGLPEHPRRQDLLFAVREHDNGWREQDSAPRLDSARGDRPYDFITMPSQIRADLWRIGCERFRHENAYAALLIVEHARSLHRQSPESAYRDLLDWLEEERSDLMEEAGIGELELETDYAYLELTDRISLVACTDWSEVRELRGMRFERRGDRLDLDPFPLAGTTTFRIPHRLIPRRTYGDGVDLAGELATARWQWREIRVGS